MVVTGLLFVCVTGVVKHVGNSLPAAQAAFMRYVLGLVFLIPMIKPIRDAHLTPRVLKLFALRGLVHSVGVALWFYAMTKISIAEVTAMNYLSPVYVTIGAVIFLAISGCRSLPQDLDTGQPSFALQPAGDGPLAELDQACVDRVENEQSCFLLLADNFKDLNWRLALID